MRAAEKSQGVAPGLAAVLQWAGGLGAVTAEALASRGGCSVASARGRLLAAGRTGLAVRWRPLTDRPALFTVTGSGLRAVGLHGIEPARVSAAGARHAVACCEAAGYPERCYPQFEVMGEPMFRYQERERGAASFSVPVRAARALGTSLHRPDLVLVPRVPGGPLPVAIEVELTVKAPARLLDICRAWARCRTLAGVIYLTTPEVQGPLARAIAAAQAAERIAGVPLEIVEGHLAEVASIERAIPGDA